LVSHAAQTEEVIKLLDADNGSYQSSSTHRIIRNRNWMIISPNATETAQHILIEENQKQVLFEAGSLTLKTHHSPLTIHHNASEAFLNLDEISFPLLLRKYKTGDYFYPLGMKKKKKISRFLIDLKLSKTEKEKVWVIESNKKIIWVIGYRIDDRFRITDQTKKILHICFDKPAFISVKLCALCVSVVKKKIECEGFFSHRDTEGTEFHRELFKYPETSSIKC
jgi:tRNA(Ile)-lysidine synthase